jgi:hypothetical protein
MWQKERKKERKNGEKKGKGKRGGGEDDKLHKPEFHAKRGNQPVVSG